MPKITLSTLGNLTNENSAIEIINGNFTTIQNIVDLLVSRDGTSPNTMTDVLDMNSQRVINLPVPGADTDAARHGDLQQYVDAAETAQEAAELAETNAETAEANAEAHEVAVQGLYDDFIPRWLGEAASNPTVDDAGDPVVSGALYFNTGSLAFRVFVVDTWYELPLTTIDALTDVTVTTPTDGDILVWATDEWVNEPLDLNSGVSTVHDRGTVTTAQSPEPSDGQMQVGVNGGAHTLNAPSETGFYRLVYTNNGSAGTITASGFDVVIDTDTTLEHTTEDSIVEINVINDGVTNLLRVSLIDDAGA